MKKTNTQKEMTNALVFLLFLLGLWMFLLNSPQLIYSQSYNESAIVNTTVNITNAAPEITAITLDTPIDLIAYSTKTVYCNATVFDYDDDVISVNATLYLEGTSILESPDNGNNHYTNTSCTMISAQGIETNYTCAFEVQYYADNSSLWICNVIASDGGLVPASNLSNYATINPLVAIKLPLLLDYGELEVGQTSNATVANVTNAGNRDANISVRGYGNTEGDGFAFICDYGTIDLEYERYDKSNETAFSSMVPVTSFDTEITDFFVPQRNTDLEDSVESTWWKVYIPVGAGGFCEGKLVFTASDKDA